MTRMALAPNTRLGRYEIRSKLGEGGMGEVYLARDTQLERAVALKILPSDVAANQERMRRFVQEAKAASALNHPHIAHIYEIGESEGAHFIAMEYLDGVTLREKIHRERTPLAKLLKYLHQVAEGLAKAHQAGIVHHDLKPDNIMVTADGYAKILDFGLAKLIEPQKVSGDQAQSEVATAMLPQHSLPGTVMGTVGYMSPEQAQGRVREIDHRSDIFSFGCILFEAATGRKAFEGKDALDSLYKIVHAPAPRIKEFNPHAPEELQRIVRRCLQKDVERRYQSIKDVAIELEELLQELKSEAGDSRTQPGEESEAPAKNSAPQQQMRNLADIAAQFVPAVKRIIEGAMLRRYTFLATVFAQIIMLVSLIRLQGERPGATRDFFAQVARFIILLPLITIGPWLISYFYSLGYQLVSPLRVPLKESVREFDDSYTRFTLGMFTATDRGGIYQPMPTGVDGIVGVLTDRESTVKSVDQLIDPAKWDMTKLFTGLNITRGIVSFATFILIVLTGFLMIAFRPAVPWMIALSLDKSLAHEVSYKFARGVVVYTLVFPIVFHIIAIIAYKTGTLGMAIYDGTPMYNVDPQTAQLIARPDVDPTFCFGVAVFMMAVSALCLIASPVIARKIAFGQTFEGVATIASGGGWRRLSDRALTS